MLLLFRAEFLVVFKFCYGLLPRNESKASLCVQPSNVFVVTFFVFVLNFSPLPTNSLLLLIRLLNRKTGVERLGTQRRQSLMSYFRPLGFFFYYLIQSTPARYSPLSVC